jgi:hypothetical protein
MEWCVRIFIGWFCACIGFVLGFILSACLATSKRWEESVKGGG